METPKVMLTNLQNSVQRLAKALLIVPFYILASVHKIAVAVCFSRVKLAPSLRENRPPSLLVPVPFQLRSVDLTQEQIPVVKWGEILRRRGSHDEEQVDDDDIDRSCAVCLTCMKEYDEVREIRSCFHVFHRECIDAWIDRGKATCPLCRSNMLISKEKFISCGGDPWRKERMIYLFGDDVTCF